MSGDAVPSIAVAVATLGKSPVLQQALAAIDQQRDQHQIDLVVLSQGQLEPSALEAIQRFANQHIKEPEPLGFAAANNICLRSVLASKTPPEFVALVNDDAVLSPGWLATLVASLEAQPEAASAQGLNLEPTTGEGEQLVDGAGIEWNARRQAVQIGHGQPARSFEHAQGAQTRFGVSATAALYRTAALRACAGPNHIVFDPTLDTYYEDVDLACRLRRAGWSALVVPAATCTHAGSSSAPSARQRLLIANRHLVLARHLGRSYLLAAPLLALRDLIDFGAHALSGWARVLRLLPGYLNWRRALPLSTRTTR